MGELDRERNKEKGKGQREEREGKKKERHSSSHGAPNGRDLVFETQKFDLVNRRFTHLSSAEMVACASWRRLTSAVRSETAEEGAWWAGSGCCCCAAATLAGATRKFWNFDSKLLKKVRISCEKAKCDAGSVVFDVCKE